MQLGEAV